MVPRIARLDRGLIVDRFRGNVDFLCDVDVATIISWLAAIPLSEWPQQDRMSVEYPYPAMVANLEWHGFRDETDSLVAFIMQRFPDCKSYHRMLSVVIPGQRIAEHDDVQAEDWRVRIHIPLITNRNCVMSYGTQEFHLEVGKAYMVGTEVPHALRNLGSDPRIHLFFDVKQV